MTLSRYRPTSISYHRLSSSSFSSSFFFVICVFVCIIFPTPGEAYGNPYVDDTARRLLWYAAAAYAPPQQVASWKFGNSLCNNKTKDFEMASVFVAKNPFSTAFAFLGVDHSRAEIITALKGTNSTWDEGYDVLQELENISYYTTHCTLNPTTTVNANAGFCDYYNDLKFVGLLDKTIGLMMKHPTYKLVITGHSLGGAAATLFALDLLTYTHSPPSFDLKLYTYGQPRAGDFVMSKKMTSGDYVSNKTWTRTLETWRITHARDLVPHLPPCCTALGYFTQCETIETCPYHQANEAWYSGNMTEEDLFVTCESGEDVDRCAGKVKTIWQMSIADHLVYFGIDVGGVCSGRIPRVPSKIDDGAILKKFLANSLGRKKPLPK